MRARRSLVRTSFAAALARIVSGCGEGAEFDREPAPTFDGGTDVPAPKVVGGAKDRILLIGTIVTPSTVIEGAVLVEGGRITCVAEGEGCRSSPGAAGATEITAEGIIAPGLVDTHNHILFDIFNDDDWLPTRSYLNHDEWPEEPRYRAMLDVKQCLSNDSQGAPAWCSATPYGSPEGSLRCEMDKWGELKGLIAGTTSIVGLPGTSGACFSSLARSIDLAQNELPEDKVQTSALFPPSDPSTVCTNLASGKTTAFLVHAGEGIDEKSRLELEKLGSITTPPNCLHSPKTAITHGTAFGAAEFAIMSASSMKLVWSPRSNVALYGQTTNVPLALDAGLTVALAPDWSMGGSQNILDELRFARTWDQAHWGGRLSSAALLQMVTSNAAKVLGLENVLGEIRVGALADLVVFRGVRAAPYDAILAARPKEISLVMVGGEALYGEPTLLAAALNPTSCESIDVCGKPKFLCVAKASSQDKLDQPLAAIRAALEKALLDADALTPSDGWSFAPLAPLVRCE